MSYDFDLVQNSATLSYFEYLQKSKLEPKMALFDGRSLMIISYNSTDILEDIYQLFLECQTALLEVFGFLDHDVQKIEAIKTEVHDYHLRKCKNVWKEYETELERLKSKNQALEEKMKWISEEQAEDNKVNNSLILLKETDDYDSDEVLSLKDKIKELEAECQGYRNVRAGVIKRCHESQKDFEKLGVKVQITSAGLDFKGVEKTEET